MIFQPVWCNNVLNSPLFTTLRLIIPVRSRLPGPEDPGRVDQ